MNETNTKFEGSYSSQMKRRSDSAKSQKRNKRKVILIVSIIVVLLAIGSLLGLKIYKNQLLKQVEGTWVYDQYTQYEFDGKGNGCMCLEEYHYEYTYSIKDDVLSIDFKDESVHDCTYTFSLENATLTIIGGEGTTGGTYKLKRQ